MKLSQWFVVLTFFAMVVAACNPFAQSTPTPFVLPLPSPIVTLTQAPASPTATLPTSSSSALPTLPPQPAGTTTPQPQAQPTSGVKRISFAPGATSATVQGNLGVNGIDYYALRISAGQKLQVSIVSPQANIIFSVNGVDGQVLKSSDAGASPWEGIVPTTQDYILTIATPTGTTVTYTLQVTIPPIAPVVQPTSAPRRITFAPGAISASVQGSTATSGQDRFVLRALAGQTMTVNAVSAQNNVIVIIYGADGNVMISDHAGATSWTGILPTTQDYFIDTRSVGSSVVNFILQVTIPPK